ncbi:MAG: hypothetical protein IK079_06005, partial [Desulfovibrio sp.]|nr:hypothetical protein [Desulfovibrio sp.]
KPYAHKVRPKFVSIPSVGPGRALGTEDKNQEFRLNIHKVDEWLESRVLKLCKYGSVLGGAGSLCRSTAILDLTFLSGFL